MLVQTPASSIIGLLGLLYDAAVNNGFEVVRNRLCGLDSYRVSGVVRAAAANAARLPSYATPAELNN